MTYNVRAHSYVVGGLGLTGQACVRFLKQQGAKVKAFDTRDTFNVSAPLNICVTTGSLPRDFFAGVDTLVLSPGLSLDIEQVIHAKACGVEVIGDVELFARLNSTPTIGITGSNGKTTVTLLTTHMLRACGYEVCEAGNVGRPVLETLPESVSQRETQPLDVIVLELSSFQLETTSSLKLNAASILNISDDHLDRHGDMQHYTAAKQRIFSHCDTAVVWRGDYQVKPISACENTITYGLDASDTGFGLREGNITFDGEALLNSADIRLAGMHNILNVMASLALCQAFGAPLNKAALAVTSFTSAPHRCVEIANINGVKWIDDSKATNVGATIAAIEGLAPITKGKIILIAGGDSKGADLSALKPALVESVSEVIALGKDAEKFSTIFDNTTLVSSMEMAVSAANLRAVSGDIVLLSPACASIDMFKNYMHRAQVFTDAVAHITASVKFTRDAGATKEAGGLPS
ncbi:MULTISPECIES: UDP-N-acetylmuramoyl-L-alanine--D-glutamate ligase [Alteromonas]|uniref:UDP-N-acetylmuramoylalanine--D-glutamate ligase n=1 Tax=Alteromonas stellipolaris TaxID=233316 RepID=A0ABM5YLK9_9ALTE|nr:MULTISPECIES: UDP-N-acetylmuramoyl-L-alanine--D-glutamate ligase [Alteromonas]ALM89478.1 UDP-N-acetylmuramoylalanine-D-glutamate ligase [Alteromonas stellipolaris LMG 21856]AMJ75399.1 UDP-N-acetylmuramoylalanine--D-glutamate ligase [Alteromonas stellipolaris]AMJ87822.1 UDP-N-acetylmuramoylalanine--D-glutamate ligase [Alteromonas sp. Mac1]AMJ91686.1 UDP-N-acetylmuramoylalanine--D-glutamate ligase [Alteromonas sp. Mac2]